MPAIDAGVQVLRLLRGQGSDSLRRTHAVALPREQRQERHDRRAVRRSRATGSRKRSSSPRWSPPPTQNREYGHTGQGFSYLWGALGANVGGPAAAAAFFKEASWHFDLVRRCDGSFTYDGGEQYGPGKTDDDTYYGKSSYYGLSPDRHVTS